MKTIYLLLCLVASQVLASDPPLVDPGASATNYALILYPLPYVAGTNYPVMIWCHGSSYDRNDPFSVYNTNLSYSIRTNGWFICSHDAHYNNWGNAASVTDYKNLLDWCLLHLPNTGKVVVLGESMGGLSSLQILNYRTNIVGWVGIYPVCSLQAAYDSGQFTPNMNAAYSIDGSHPYSTQTAGHDPLLWPAANFTVRMRFYASPDDTVVPKAQHTDPMQARCVLALERGVVLCSGNHGDASHFRPDDVASFLHRCLNNRQLNVGRLNVGKIQK